MANAAWDIGLSLSLSISLSLSHLVDWRQVPDLLGPLTGRNVVFTKNYSERLFAKQRKQKVYEVVLIINRVGFSKYLMKFYFKKLENNVLLYI